MASTSGEIIGNHVIVTGSAYAVIRIDWQLASQNTAGNYSTINWQTYVDFFACDAELDNGTVSVGGAVRWSNGGRVYNYAGNFSNHTITLGSGTFNIGADGSGNTTLNASGSIAVYQSGTSSTSGSWTLPTINRTAAITNLSLSNTSDVGFTINASTDVVCSQIQYSLDGGSTFATISGNASTWTIPITNRPSNTTFNIKIVVTDADSGLTTTSGVVSTTTLPQNNFFLA